MRTAVLTISTSVSRREAEDESGPLLARLAEEAGCDVEAMEVVPDDFALIEDRLHHYVDAGVRFIFTTGGTGMTPDDITPEATRAVIERAGAGLRRGDARRGAAPHAAWGSSRAAISGIAEPHADRQLPRQPEGGRRAVRRAGADAAPRRATRWAASDGRKRRPLSSTGSSAATASGRRSTASSVAVPAGRDAGRCSAPTARASRRCCACWRRCCARRAASARVLGHALPARGLEGARPRRAARPRAAAATATSRARENLRFHARLHGVRVRAHRRAAGPGRPGGARRRAGARALARHGAAGGRLPRRAARARGAAARRADARTSTRRRPTRSSRWSGARAGARAW